jgi:hypothetical protein
MYAGVVTAVIGAGTAIYSASQAGKSQQGAANSSGASNDAQYMINRIDNMPWHDAGADAVTQLQQGMAPGAEFNNPKPFSMADFQADPGYQFRMDEGQKAIERSAAARGGVLGGGTMKAIANYGQNLASSEFQNAYNRYTNDRNTRYNRLSNLAGLGQTANAQLGAAGANYVNNAASIANSAGNAGAAQSIATGNAINQGIGSLANAYTNYQTMNRLFPESGGGDYTVSNGNLGSLDN